MRKTAARPRSLTDEMVLYARGRGLGSPCPYSVRKDFERDLKQRFFASGKNRELETRMFEWGGTPGRIAVAR